MEGIIIRGNWVKYNWSSLNYLLTSCESIIISRQALKTQTMLLFPHNIKLGTLEQVQLLVIFKPVSPFIFKWWYNK